MFVYTQKPHPCGWGSELCLRSSLLPRGSWPRLSRSIVVLQPQVGDQVCACDMTQRVLQLHRLDKQIVLGIKPRGRLRRLEIKAQPLLNADAAQFGSALGQVEEQHQVERDGRGQNRVAAKEVHLDLHRIAKPAEDVDVVPGFLVVAPRRVIVDADFVVDVLVQVGVKLRLEDVIQRAQLRLFLGLE